MRGDRPKHRAALSQNLLNTGKGFPFLAPCLGIYPSANFRPFLLLLLLSRLLDRLQVAQKLPKW